MHEHRRGRIVNLVFQKGHVTVRELTKEIGVSEATIRRDLSYLASRGVIQRSRGGATTPEVWADRPLWPSYVPTEMNLEKAAIGHRAAELVKPGQWIFLENGGTTLAVARALVRVPRIQVVTNSLHIAYLLNTHGRCSDVYLTGGTLRRDTYLLGPLALNTLEQVQVDIAFIGAKWFSVERGITEPDLVGAQMKKAVMGIARRVVLVAGHRKIGTEGPILVEPLTRVHTLVTSAQADPKQLAAIAELGVKVITCDE